MRRAALAKLRSLRRDGSPFIWFRSPLGRMASLAALVLILALGGIILLRRPGPEPVEQDIFRSGGELSLDLESPRGETVFEDLVFVWRSYRHAETYGFELLNPDLALLWSDGVKRRTRLELPPGVRQLLRPGAYYFWKVKAFDSNGRELASGLQSFRLK